MNHKDSEKGRALHQLAETAKENGSFIEALYYTDQASIAYQLDKDLVGLAEVQSSRQSTFEHLFRTTGDVVYLVLEKHAAQSAVEIAEMSGVNEGLAIPYHNLGKYFFVIKDYKKASEWFSKAVENLEKYPQKRHGRPAVIADIKGHLYVSQYFAGDKTALKKVLEVLEDLKKADEDSYNKNVWISGAHLRIAEMLIKDDPKLAKNHLAEAEKVIGSDKRLALREGQLKKLKKQFTS